MYNEKRQVPPKKNLPVMLFPFVPDTCALVVAVCSVCKLEGAGSLTIVVLDGK